MYGQLDAILLSFITVVVAIMLDMSKLICRHEERRRRRPLTAYIEIRFPAAVADAVVAVADGYHTQTCIIIE